MCGWVCPRCKQVITESGYASFGMTQMDKWMYICRVCYEELKRKSDR